MTFNSSGSVVNGDSACIGVVIHDDDIYEEDQLFNISIASVSPSSVAIIGTTNNVVITIRDNGGLLIYLLDAVLIT